MTANTAPSASAQSLSATPIATRLTTAVHDAFDQLSGGLPTVPADSPLALAFAALQRRESATAHSVTSALATASLTLSNPISINPSLGIFDGIYNGSTGATTTSTNPLTYTLISGPSAGGKVTFDSSGDLGYVRGDFTYLPDLSIVASGTEQFRMLVSENTQFDKFLENIPIVGLFVPQTLVVLHQTPVLGDLLSPVLGYSRVVIFTADPSASNPLGDPIAFTYKVPSFDGTLISTNFYPASTSAVPAGTAAPTILNGPGIGYAGSTDPYSVYETTAPIPLPGIETLRAGGYNVITWDPRGEYASGGILQLDSPFYEARDVTAIINWATGLNSTGADNPYVTKVEVDALGDPLLGMTGGSYGGGIQWVSAATDSRIDAIVPGISWNSLNSSLYPDSAFKTTYSSLLLLGLVLSGARINNQIYAGIITGALVGFISEVAQSVLASSGPTVLVNNIDIPSLLVQGTVDPLFTLDQAMANGQMLAANGEIAKMIWYCGGHGNGCLNPSPSQNALVLDSAMAWFDQYVNGDGNPADGIPVFQYVDQVGDFYQSTLLPTDPGFVTGSVMAAGAGGLLGLVPAIGGSGPVPSDLIPIPYSLAGAYPASNAINVTIPTEASTTYVVGSPTLTFSYAGLGTSRFVYAQIVDGNTGLVVGNIVTPVPVVLDGRERQVSIPMEAIAYTMSPGDSLRLQITSSATAFENFTQFGAINISDIALSLPTTTAVTPET